MFAACPGGILTSWPISSYQHDAIELRVGERFGENEREAVMRLTRNSREAEGESRRTTEESFSRGGRSVINEIR